MSPLSKSRTRCCASMKFDFIRWELLIKGEKSYPCETSSMIVLELSTLGTPVSNNSCKRRISPADNCAECSSAHSLMCKAWFFRSTSRRRVKRRSASRSLTRICSNFPPDSGCLPKGAWFTTRPVSRSSQSLSGRADMDGSPPLFSGRHLSGAILSGSTQPDYVPTVTEFNV